mgnify:CR=1 FL=1
MPRSTAICQSPEILAPVAADGLADARAHLHLDARHTRDLEHCRARLVAHLILHRTRRRRQLDGERDASALPHHADRLADRGLLQVLVVAAGVFVTAFYSFRMLFLAFHGKERFREAVRRVKPELPARAAA